MKKVLILFTVTIATIQVFAQSRAKELNNDAAFSKAVSKWFSAWQLLSKDIYKIKKVQPVDFVFFDDRYVYSTSRITIRNGTPVNGCNLMNLQLKWNKKLHKDSIVLPNNTKIPVGLMSFAAEAAGKNNSPFFVMALPQVWKKYGVASKELGLDNLITGVFLHEFSHSQQMNNFGKRITDFEQQQKWPVEFNDDVIQSIFINDSAYTNSYKNETAIFYQSVQNNALNLQQIEEGLKLMSERREKHFTDRYASLTEAENLFLTMEGLGQYSMYSWLIHPRGANIIKELAIEGVRRKRNRWSQDEGFALFLVLDKLSAPNLWVQQMFGKEYENVLNLIKQKMKM